MAYSALPELIAMQQIADIVADLSAAERRRVGLWLVEYTSQPGVGNDVAPGFATDATNEGVSVEFDSAPVQPAATSAASDEVAAAPSTAPTTFAEAYAAAAPRKGAQKAAVAGWWLETAGGQGSWKASEVNKLLKSLDVKVSSMSIVLTNAVKAKAPLVVELGRLGDGERSRKTFRLSDAGRAYVESALA